MLKQALPALTLCFLSLPAWSQSADAPAPQTSPAVASPADAAAPTLADGEPLPQTVLVSGSRPGPGLWKVSKNDHVMWVFGTYSPLPAKLEWRSRDVEKVIAGSQEYLQPPGAGVGVGWSGLMALPFMIGMKKLPNGAELKDVLPPDVYARWQPLKLKYFGNDSDIERERPTFVATELYSRVLKAEGLSGGDDVHKRIVELAKKHKLKFTDASYHVEIKEPGKALREFKKSGMDDAPCLAKTIDSLEGDISVLRARANAWAVGELGEIRKLNFADRGAACTQALGTSAVAQLQPELKDLRKRAAEKWIDAAEKALAANASTFTIVHLKDILDPQGVIATLAAKGYTVEPPK